MKNQDLIYNLCQKTFGVEKQIMVFKICERK